MSKRLQLSLKVGDEDSSQSSVSSSSTEQGNSSATSSSSSNATSNNSTPAKTPCYEPLHDDDKGEDPMPKTDEARPPLDFKLLTVDGASGEQEAMSDCESLARYIINMIIKNFNLRFDFQNFAF